MSDFRFKLTSSSFLLILFGLSGLFTTNMGFTGSYADSRITLHFDRLSGPDDVLETSDDIIFTCDNFIRFCGVEPKPIIDEQYGSLGVHFSGDNFIGRVSIDSPLGVPSGLLNADANPNCTPSPPHETCDLASPAPLTVSFDLPQTVIRVNIFAYIERSGTGVPVTLKDASGNTISSFVLHNSETIVPLGFNNSQQLAGRFQLSASTPFTTVIFNKTLPNNGGFGIDSLEFLSKEKAGICPEKNVQHWDKIIFAITDPILAKKVNLTAGTELDIKVLDDPHKVVDIKQKVLDSLKVPTAPKKAIRILDVNYAIICASQTPSGIKSSVENATEAKY